MPTESSLTSTLSIPHRLWRALPRDLRRKALYGAIDGLAPRPSPPDRLRPGPLAVGGLLTTASGLGESARLCRDALRALGWDPRHADLSAFFGRQDLPEPLPGFAAQPGEAGVFILHINGPYMPYVALRLGRAFLEGRRIIGYWAWELPRMGDDWRRGLRQVHELWVPSRFIANSLPAETTVPVRIVPHPVDQHRVPPARDRFSIPAGVFTVLAAFDMGSSYTRKNPRAAVGAFRQAFGDDPRCLLLLKIGHGGDAGWAMADLRAAIAGMSNVRILQETLTRSEMTQLIASADAVLSLHRSEGFGLLLAEAMLQGVPVVATRWSGNLDFMSEADSALVDYRLIPPRDPQGAYDRPDLFWADADIAHAADWLARLRADRNLRGDLGRRGQEAAAEKLSLTAYRAAIGDSLA
jgi:glycosyltransferase involved in cell wall biosynthesis